MTGNAHTLVVWDGDDNRGVSHPGGCKTATCPYTSKAFEQEAASLEPGIYKVTGGASPQFDREDADPADEIQSDGAGTSDPDETYDIIDDREVYDEAVAEARAASLGTGLNNWHEDEDVKAADEAQQAERTKKTAKKTAAKKTSSK